MSIMLEKVSQAWLKAWGTGETKAFEDIVAPNYIRHSKTSDEHLEDVIKQIEASHEAFTNFDLEILNSVEDEDSIAIHWQANGVHTGNFMGVPPTGRKVVVSGAAFIRHADGQIVEETTVWDPRELLSAIKIMHLGAESKVS